MPELHSAVRTAVHSADIEALRPYILMALVVMVFPLVAGYIVLMERKIMADMQVRLGPMRVGPHGLLQPIADALKLLLKEDIIPGMVDKWVFWLAPIISVTTALVAFSVIPFGPEIYITDLNIGILFVLAVSSVGILGIILGGWASNSHYPLLGSLRSTAQMVSYEVVMGFAIVSILLMAGTLSMVEIVEAQRANHTWFLFGKDLTLLPFGLIAGFMYLVAGMAETNRAPFDLPEAESELVAGFMTEYSGFRWALYFLAEYANIFIISSIAVTLFLGGWLRPFPNVQWLAFIDFLPGVLMLGIAGYCAYRAPKQPVQIQKLVMLLFGGLCVLLAGVLGWAFILDANSGARAGILGGFWFLAKVFAYIYGFMWFRFTFPRYRYDQLMKLGWQVMIPLGIANVIAIAGVLLLRKG